MNIFGSLRNPPTGPLDRVSPGMRAIDIVTACAFAMLLLDRPMALYFHALAANPLTAAAAAIPDLGNSSSLLALTLLALGGYRLLAGDRPWSNKMLLVVGAGALSGLCCDFLTGIFGRMPPSAFVNEGKYGFLFFNLAPGVGSFPSGHAAVAAGLASAASTLSPGNRMIFMNAAAAVAATTVITGEHFPSDALCGFAIGLAANGIVKRVLHRFEMPFETLEISANSNGGLPDGEDPTGHQ